MLVKIGGKDIASSFHVVDVELLSAQEADVLMTEETRAMNNLWWLRSLDDDGHLQVVDPKGNIQSAPDVAVDWQLGVRPAMWFHGTMAFNVGDKIEAGGETWTVALVSPVADSIAICDRLVERSVFNTSDFKSPKDYENSFVRSWIDRWSIEHGLVHDHLALKMGLTM